MVNARSKVAQPELSNGIWGQHAEMPDPEFCVELERIADLNTKYAAFLAASLNREAARRIRNTTHAVSQEPS